MHLHGSVCISCQDGKVGNGHIAFFQDRSTRKACLFASAAGHADVRHALSNGYSQCWEHIEGRNIKKSRIQCRHTCTTPGMTLFNPRNFTTCNIYFLLLMGNRSHPRIRTSGPPRLNPSGKLVQKFAFIRTGEGYIIPKHGL